MAKTRGLAKQIGIEVKHAFGRVHEQKGVTVTVRSISALPNSSMKKFPPLAHKDGSAVVPHSTSKYFTGTG